MNASVERALLVECYMTMREMADMFNGAVGSEVGEIPDATNMSDSQMLGEMRDALSSVRQQIGPALKTPMIQMLLKKMR